ncbi:mechanosensitive ion channel family protein [Paenimyroides ceti]
MKKTLYLCLLLLPFCLSAQEKSSDSTLHLINKQLKELKALRTKDSLKIDVLTHELKELLTRTSYTDSNGKSTEKENKDSLRIKQQLEEINRIKARTEGAPVVLQFDTLFRIYANLGPYTALERAQTSSNKIKNLYEKAFYHKDSLKIKHFYNNTTISYENEIIMGVSELDALWDGSTVEELALSNIEKINNSVLNLRKENSLQNKIYRLIELVLIIFAVGILIYFLNFLFKKMDSFILHHSSFLKKGLKVKNYELIKKNQLNSLISKFLILLKYIFFIIIFISSIPIALKLFPATQVWAEEMQKIFLEPLKSLSDSIIDYLPNLVKIIFIIIAIRFILRLLRYFTLEIERENLTLNGFHKEWAKPTYLIIRFLFICLTLIIVFPYLPGFDTVAFQGVSVFLGILISIGSSSAIANAVAGIVITYMRPFQTNDWIKTGNVIGVVIEKNSLVTRLKTINNEDVTVPNSAILSGPTINFSSIGKTDGLALTAQVKIRYEFDERIVTNLLISAALKTVGVSKRLSPYVFQLELNEINATYEINALTFEPQNMYFIKSDLIKNIKKEFKHAEIPLSSIQYVEIKENPLLKK